MIRYNRKKQLKSKKIKKERRDIMEKIVESIDTLHTHTHTQTGTI